MNGKNNLLLENLNQLSTTDLGAQRICKNISLPHLTRDEVVNWCKEKCKQPRALFEREGKNWYVFVDEVRFTINAHSYTLITAHKVKQNKLPHTKELPEKTAKKFVEAINTQNLTALIELMHEDFIFIDTYGEKENKEAMKIGWKGYFDWFPDYKISVDSYLAGKNFSVILGAASGSFQGKTDRHWEFPAAWKVAVQGEQVILWQVFCDSKKQLDSMK